VKRLLELINNYKEAAPPPRFGIVAPLSACFDELEGSKKKFDNPRVLTAPINIALGNVFAEGDVGLLVDYSLWLWLSEVSGQSTTKQGERQLLTRVFGSPPEPFDVPLVGTLTDKECEFKLWRSLPTIQPLTAAESISNKNQRPVFSLHARNGEVSHMRSIIKMLTHRCNDQWQNEFRVLAPEDLRAQSA